MSWPRPLALVVLAAACGGTSEPTPAPAPAESSNEGTDHGGTPSADAGHAAHAGGSSHMEQMAAQRTALRQALGPAYDAPVPGLEAADVTRGKALYGQHCASCHGAAGKGDGEAAKGLNPPPADFTDAFHSRYYADAGRVHVIEQGIPGTAMAAFSGTLTHEQVLDLYAFVRQLRGGAPAAAPEDEHHDHEGHDHDGHEGHAP